MRYKKKHLVENSLKNIVKTSIIVFIGILISKLFAYVYRIIIARNFGPEVYGRFSLALIILGWFGVFASLGFHEGVLRYISIFRSRDDKDRLKYLYHISLSFIFFLSLLSGIILFIFSEYISVNIFHDTNLVIFLRIFSIGVPFFALSNILLAVIQGFEKIKEYTFIFDITPSIIKIFMLLLFIYLGFNSNSIIISYILGLLLIYLLSYYYCKKYLIKHSSYDLDKQSKSKIKKDLFSYSWPLVFLGLLDAIFFYIDSLTIGYFKGTLEVGLYTSAVSIAMLLGFFPTIFMRLFLPIVTKEYAKKNLSLVKELSKQVEKWVFIINLPVFALMFLFPGAFINLLFGSEYISAEIPLRILSISFFIYSLSVIFYNLLSMAGKSKTILFNTVITAVINLTLNIIIVPIYGMSGAAFTTLFSQIILFFLLFFQVKKYTSIIPLRKKMIGIALCSIFPALFIFYLRRFIEINLFSLIMLASFFMLIYLLLIFISRSLDNNDLMIISSIKNKFLHQI
ncbi:MAG: flippase [Nanoarchaeota archaeon]|nr:flippase [Nanoarchaeota archaeon]